MENDSGHANWPRLSRRTRLGARLVLGLAALCWAAGPAPVRAQEGGVLAEFCKEGPDCAEDALEIVFESGTSTHQGPLEPGTEIPIQVVIDMKGPGVQGFSYAVKHDPGSLTLLPERLTTEGTIFDSVNPDARVGPPFLALARPVAGGFIAAAVLRITEWTEMPLGRSVICRAAYRVEISPSCTVIRFVDRQLTSSQHSPTVSVTIARADGSRVPVPMYPRFFRHGLVGSGTCTETCDDLADDDGDGLVDCDDPDCAAYPLCTGEEICGDGIDNNANGRVDCNDRPCNEEPSCPDEECSDALDNDDDGRIDCEDPDCFLREPCSPPRPVETCDDGVDNDGDLLADCDDTDCLVWFGGWCWSYEVCDDGRDNDRDSRADCSDRDCAGNPACPDLELCGDGKDNDGDGSLDCDDPDCTYERPCIEDCADGIDNDRDGFVDALDRSCSGYIPGGIPGGSPPMRRYIRGDADGNGRVNVLDALVILRGVAGETPGFDCTEALNTNADGGVDAADALPVLQWIFLQGPPLPHPFPRCDWDASGGCTQSSPGC